MTEAIQYPRGEGKFAVRATWTGFGIGPPSNTRLTLHQIKNELFVGTWNVVGVESHSKLPREVIVILEPGETAQAIEPGDILIVGRGAVSKYAATVVEPRPQVAKALELGRDGLRGILLPSRVLGTELLVFHSPGDDITDADLAAIRPDVNLEPTSFVYVGTTIARYTLEFKLSGKAVSARSIIDMLVPVRSFVLDASEEMCLDIPRKRRRRSQAESELFEPVITAKAASVRFRIHASASSRSRELETSKPLRLLSEVLQLANAGNRNGMRRALEESVKSVDESLKQVEDIVKTARKQNVEFSATDTPRPVVFGNRALSTVQSAETVEPYMVELVGDLYAVDFHRKWCRVSRAGVDTLEDWRLEFSDDLKDDLRGEYPRRVVVEFQSRTARGKTPGKGLLLSIAAWTG